MPLAKLGGLMSDGNGSSKGVQAYRWLVTIGMGLLAYLSIRVLDSVDKTATAVTALQIQVTTLSGTTESRINAHADRLRGIDDRNVQQDTRMDRQDMKIEGIQQRIWQLPARLHVPSSPAPEEQQRQNWQQK